MKKLLISICLSITLITSPIAFQGCKEFPSFSQQSSDQIILRAEQAAQTAQITFKTFVHIERENEALLLKLNPAIHQYAETIRAHGVDWIVSLRNATKTFEATRTAENQATLNTILTTLTAAVADTNKYIAASKKAIAP